MPRDLRKELRERLPQAVLHLMEQIEDFAKTEIEVRPSPYPVAPNDINASAPAAVVTHERAALFLRRLSSDHILHELLHIQRYWVDEVPQVLPSANLDRNLRITSMIENNLEHMVIVPREVDYGFDPYPYWNRIMAASWAQYPWSDIHDKVIRRQKCLMGWLATDLVTGPHIIKKAESAIQAEGYMVEARKFRSRLKGLIGSKPRAISCVLRFFRIPQDQAQLVYYDIRNRCERRVAIPDH